MRLRSTDEDDEAAAVRRAWNGVYDVGHAGGAWHACCLSGAPVLLTAKTPGELGGLIRADWVRRGTR